MSSSIRSLLVLFFLVFIARTAPADVPAPTVTACNGKATGDECDLSGGTKGSCQASRCAMNECLECKQGATTTRPDSGTAPPTTDDGGCSIGVARAAGPWLLALAVPAVAFAIRKRRPRRT
jgi:hypothetical protein